MLGNTNEFKIFGDGTDKLIISIGKDVYIFKNAFMREMSYSRKSPRIDVTNMYGLSDGRYRQFIPGNQMAQIDLGLSCHGIDIIQDADIKKYINPLMNKSVLELMQIVNQKLKGRN